MRPSHLDVSVTLSKTTIDFGKTALIRPNQMRDVRNLGSKSCSLSFCVLHFQQLVSPGDGW